MLSTGTLLAMALVCAPRVSPGVLLSVAYAESHWNPLAIHDNWTGKTIIPADTAGAVRVASRLITEGRQPDLGLMQVSTRNLSRSGLSVQQAFEPCESLRAGGAILLGDYAGGRTPAQKQSAIRQALSAYNTGSPWAGLKTYTPLVLAAARKVIPALRLAGVAPLKPSSPYASRPARNCTTTRWHFSAEANACPGTIGWHVSAVSNQPTTSGFTSTNSSDEESER